MCPELVIDYLTCTCISILCICFRQYVHKCSSYRASYFSSNPTDKMYAVVAAAKALYDQLGMLREMSIDGDSFLDLWVYVILKANIKDLVW